MQSRRATIVFAGIAGAVILLLFAVALLIGRLESEPAVSNAVERGSNATSSVIYATSFPDLSGKSQPIAQWSQRLLVINFWASWCAPCIEEIPLLVQMQQKYQPQGLQIIGIAADSQANAAKFAQKLAINYPVLPDEGRAIAFSKRVGNRLGLLPFSVVVGADGRIIMTKLGVFSASELETIIINHLPRS
ncbi:MAG: TlpA family protein disulfide reductase [Aeromicrobium sp.]|nr:TlpA family protein disulfide reductase [Burkholderiales bacterium]